MHTVFCNQRMSNLHACNLPIPNFKFMQIIVINILYDTEIGARFLSSRVSCPTAFVLWAAAQISSIRRSCSATILIIDIYNERLVIKRTALPSELTSCARLGVACANIDTDRGGRAIDGIMHYQGRIQRLRVA